MNLKEDIRPISFIKKYTSDIVKQVNTTHRPIIITQNGEAKAVLLDTESFESMQKAIMMLKLLSQSEEDIEKGNVISQEKVFEQIEKKYFTENE